MNESENIDVIAKDEDQYQNLRRSQEQDITRNIYYYNTCSDHIYDDLN